MKIKRLRMQKFCKSLQLFIKYRFYANTLNGYYAVASDSCRCNYNAAKCVNTACIFRRSTSVPRYYSLCKRQTVKLMETSCIRDDVVMKTTNWHPTGGELVLDGSVIFRPISSLGPKTNQWKICYNLMGNASNEYQQITVRLEAGRCMIIYSLGRNYCSDQNLSDQLIIDTTC